MSSYDKLHGGVIVTGFPGWLATRLVEALLDPDRVDTGDPSLSEKVLGDGRVRCLVHPAVRNTRIPEELRNRIEIVVGDIRDRAAVDELLNGMEGATVFHIAGVIHPRRAREFDEVNHQGTRNLLSACGEVGRFVYMSSNSPIGCGRPGEIFDENSSFNPYLGYGASKMKAELAVQEVVGRGLEAVIIRSPWFYGPRQPGRQTLFFRTVCSGTFPIVGKGNNLRSMAYVDNICQGLLRAALAAPGRGEAFWIADERPYPMMEIIETVRSVLVNDFHFQCRKNVIRLPGLVSEMAYWADRTLQAVGLYNEKIHVVSELNKTIACSVDNACTQIGYNPQVSLREGMRRSVQWCVDHGMI